MEFTHEGKIAKLDETKVTDPDTIRRIAGIRSFFSGMRLGHALIAKAKARKTL
jgi:hypothetical protein